MKEIGSRIRKARKLAGFTQKELSEILGLAVGTVLQYEAGKREPTMEKIDRIAFELDTTSEWLLFGKSRVIHTLEEELDDEFDYPPDSPVGKAVTLYRFLESCGFIKPDSEKAEYIVSPSGYSLPLLTADVKDWYYDKMRLALENAAEAAHRDLVYERLRMEAETDNTAKNLTDESCV